MIRSSAVVPRRIGRYEVLGQLATGGMAEILLARLPGAAGFARAVVIKRILRQYAKDPTFVTMFLDEARVVATIRHPNVVQVHELGEDNGEVFLVLEYVAGENLSSVLKRSIAQGEPLDAALVAHIAAEACAGLHAAHELVSDGGRYQNLVHRDVSPQNLFVAYDGHVKLLDFGVALTDERNARTEVGGVKGKLEYMSPEQARAEPLDRRSDIFAMGTVLYELGTGRRLFKRNMPARTLEAICTDPVLPPSRLAPAFPPALETIIMKALAKDPRDRFATAAEMRRELQAVAHALTRPGDLLAERMQRWFGERIAEKNEMLRRLTDGHEVTRVPAGEAFEEVRVPQVPDHVVPAAPAAEARSRRWAVFAIGVVAIVAIGAAASVAARRRGAKPVVLTSASAASSAAPSAAPSLSPAEQTSAAPASEVLVHVQSSPPGARVLADGEERGITPIDLHLARGNAPVVIELRRVGFAAVQQQVVPDADQKLLLSLAPRRGAGASAGAKAPAPGSSGFRRFD